jgi:hypothetical protein
MKGFSKGSNNEKGEATRKWNLAVSENAYCQG